MKVILISGKAEAGKTLTATIIRTYLMNMGYHVALLPYGDYVKFTAKQIFNWNGQKDEEGRALLQWWGTEIARKNDNDFWVDNNIRLATKIRDNLNIEYIIIDDCRFPNEIEAWKSWKDVLTVRIERPGHKNALTPQQRKHPSECALDNYTFDVTIKAADFEELKYAIYEQILPKIDNDMTPCSKSKPNLKKHPELFNDEDVHTLVNSLHASCTNKNCCDCNKYNELDQDCCEPELIFELYRKWKNAVEK